MNTLQERIRWAYAQAKEKDPALTKTTIWRACGLSSGALSQWFNGPTQSIEGRHAQTVADILGVDRDWLAFGDGQPQQTAAALMPPRHMTHTPDAATFRVLDARAACGAGCINADHPELVRPLVLSAEEARALVGPPTALAACRCYWPPATA